MYPIEKIYGPRAYRTFEEYKAPKGKSLKVPKGKSLKKTRESSVEVSQDKNPLTANNYTELVDIVSYLSVMNKRYTLYFRGQTKDGPLWPAIFRSNWTSLGDTKHSIPNKPDARRAIWNRLGNEISSIVRSACDELPMPRPNTLKMFREAVWAVAQHYGLWPTPLIDITPSLRTAASFALWGGQSEGYLYVVALTPSTNSVTFDADQHIVLARLQAVCPPVAKRPHFQDGFLAGRFPFESPVSNDIDDDPRKVSDLANRLVAKIKLTDADDEARRQTRKPSGKGFWTVDFPRMSPESLMPKAEHDELLQRFAPLAAKIDELMDQVCQPRAGRS